MLIIIRQISTCFEERAVGYQHPECKVRAHPSLEGPARIKKGRNGNGCRVLQSYPRLYENSLQPKLMHTKKIALPSCLKKIIPTEKLPVQALARLEFGEHLLSMLGLADTVKLKVAKNLPPSEGSARAGIAGGSNANAFRNSYMWEASTGILNVHGT